MCCPAASPPHQAAWREGWELLLASQASRGRSILPLLAEGHAAPAVAEQVGASEKTVDRAKQQALTVLERYLDWGPLVPATHLPHTFSAN